MEYIILSIIFILVYIVYRNKQKKRQTKQDELVKSPKELAEDAFVNYACVELGYDNYQANNDYKIETTEGKKNFVSLSTSASLKSKIAQFNNTFQQIRENDYLGHLNFHGGCIECITPTTNGIYVCTGCQYFEANWDKPNLKKEK